MQKTREKDTVHESNTNIILQGQRYQNIIIERNDMFLDGEGIQFFQKLFYQGSIDFIYCQDQHHILPHLKKLNSPHHLFILHKIILSFLFYKHQTISIIIFSLTVLFIYFQHHVIC